jgi:hypothetical protein
MPRIPVDLPEAPPTVFSLATPLHMLMKLSWEISQFKKSLLPVEVPPILESVIPAYHAYNCAVTAWHCTDWAWSFGDDYVHRALAGLLGFPLGRNNRINLKEFGKAVSRKSRDVYICRLVANGSKHMKLDRVDSSVRAMSVWAPRDNPSNEDIALGREYVTRLYIVDGEERLLPEEIFEHAFRYWHRLFQQVGYAEPTYIGED